MIQVVLEDKRIENLECILVRLAEENLITNVRMTEEISYEILHDGSFLKFKQYKMTGISRTILSKELMDCIKENSHSDSLSYYTIPIIDMDWQQSDKVKEYFDKVKLVS